MRLKRWCGLGERTCWVLRPLLELQLLFWVTWEPSQSFEQKNDTSCLILKESLWLLCLRKTKQNIGVRGERKRPVIRMICVFSRSACLTLWGPTDCSPPGSSVHGISQARILEWVAISSSRGSSWPRDRAPISCIARWILYHWDTWKALHLVCCAMVSDGQLFAAPWTVTRQAPLSMGIL